MIILWSIYVHELCPPEPKTPKVKRAPKLAEVSARGQNYTPPRTQAGTALPGTHRSRAEKQPAPFACAKATALGQPSLLR